MDLFSSWPEVQVLPDKSVPSVIDLFITNIICQFGCPTQILTDNGHEFDNNLIHGPSVTKDFEELHQEVIANQSKAQEHHLKHKVTSVPFTEAELPLADRFSHIFRHHVSHELIKRPPPPPAPPDPMSMTHILNDRPQTNFRLQISSEEM
ncbi:hypothetical protein BJ085DRAFT_31652 [Dimargaris cristalligena]|uniref:Integrase catalytic domain-containing protein n=1 Tax=Dimargaris cristalligena TaxID=215637 RepID=A0A4V1J3U8_9FUNG|nr:hypothetical protein BJ085DRAFT_31652 [Dimargaris cristalligena]|eukprot:RKP33309.1 hypothetical protein BJ085DRAFT_31652 [Dimargaris cristalligena]